MRVVLGGEMRNCVSRESIVFKVLFFTHKLSWILNFSSFLKYLATTPQINVLFFFHPSTWNYWELKLFLWALQLQTAAKRLDLNLRNGYNSLNNLSGRYCVNHAEFPRAPEDIVRPPDCRRGGSTGSHWIAIPEKKLWALHLHISPTDTLTESETGV